MSKDIDHLNGSIPKGILGLGDTNYPNRISRVFTKKSPEKISYLGNLELLHKMGVGMCGARNVSEKGLNIAAECSEELVRNNLVVISGYARGVDQQAHYQALRCGGETIIILPEGINNFSIRKVLRNVWDWDRVLVLSQFPDNAKWRAYQAMTRNKLILGLSNAMVVIEAGEKGGTMNSGIEALKSGIPLFVCDYDRQDKTSMPEGNQILINKGAKMLGKARHNLKTNVGKIISTISSKQSDNVEDNQLCLV